MIKKLNNKQGQVAPFMILVVAVLILAIAATMLIGEAGFQKIRLANVADSSLISTASALCRTLNQIRIINSRMLLNYIQLQTMLLVMSPFETKIRGYTTAWAASLYGITSSYELYKQAEEVAEGAGKSLRIGLYDSIFGSALVDEPKPFLASEVTRDDNTGKIIALDYGAYLKRDSHFILTLRDFKEGNGDWYNNNLLSYSWNKTKEEVLNQPGVINPGEPDVSYEAYLRTELQDVPSSISVDPQPMVLIFFFCQPCKYGCCWWPGFVINPWAWIRKVDIDSDNYGVSLEKKVPFQRFPFFGREVTLNQQSRVHITGSVWTGYNFSLEE